LVTVLAYLVVAVAIATFVPFTIVPREVKALTVTELVFTVGDSLSGRIAVQVTNTGTCDVTVGVIEVDGEIANIWSSKTSDTLVPGNSETFTAIQNVASGTEYYVTFWDVHGTFLTTYTDTA
jgi:hypothetical protein